MSKALDPKDTAEPLGMVLLSLPLPPYLNYLYIKKPKGFRLTLPSYPNVRGGTTACFI